MPSDKFKFSAKNGVTPVIRKLYNSHKKFLGKSDKTSTTVDKPKVNGITNSIQKNQGKSRNAPTNSFSTYKVVRSKSKLEPVTEKEAEAKLLGEKHVYENVDFGQETVEGREKADQNINNNFDGLFVNDSFAAEVFADVNLSLNGCIINMDEDLCEPVLSQDLDKLNCAANVSLIAVGDCNNTMALERHYENVFVSSAQTEQDKEINAVAMVNGSPENAQANDKHSSMFFDSSTESNVTVIEVSDPTLNENKLRIVIDNFDKIINEYTAPKGMKKPRLQKSKTCSIIESKCILKKNLSAPFADGSVFKSLEFNVSKAKSLCNLDRGAFGMRDSLPKDNWIKNNHTGEGDFWSLELKSVYKTESPVPPGTRRDKNKECGSGWTRESADNAKNKQIKETLRGESKVKERKLLNQNTATNRNNTQQTFGGDEKLGSLEKLTEKKVASGQDKSRDRLETCNSTVNVNSSNISKVESAISNEDAPSLDLSSAGEPGVKEQIPIKVRDVVKRLNSLEDETKSKKDENKKPIRSKKSCVLPTGKLVTGPAERNCYGLKDNKRVPPAANRTGGEDVSGSKDVADCTSSESNFFDLGKNLIVATNTSSKQISSYAMARATSCTDITVTTKKLMQSKIPVKSNLVKVFPSTPSDLHCLDRTLRCTTIDFGDESSDFKRNVGEEVRPTVKKSVSMQNLLKNSGQKSLSVQNLKIAVQNSQNNSRYVSRESLLVNSQKFGLKSNLKASAPRFRKSNNDLRPNVEKSAPQKCGNRSSSVQNLQKVGTVRKSVLEFSQSVKSVMDKSGNIQSISKFGNSCQNLTKLDARISKIASSQDLAKKIISTKKLNNHNNSNNNKGADNFFSAVRQANILDEEVECRQNLDGHGNSEAKNKPAADAIVQNATGQNLNGPKTEKHILEKGVSKIKSEAESVNCSNKKQTLVKKTSSYSAVPSEKNKLERNSTYSKEYSNKVRNRPNLDAKFVNSSEVSKCKGKTNTEATDRNLMKVPNVVTKGEQDFIKKFVKDLKSNPELLKDDCPNFCENSLTSECKNSKICTKSELGNSSGALIKDSENTKNITDYTKNILRKMNLGIQTQLQPSRVTNQIEGANFSATPAEFGTCTPMAKNTLVKSFSAREGVDNLAESTETSAVATCALENGLSASEDDKRNETIDVLRTDTFGVQKSIVEPKFFQGRRRPQTKSKPANNGPTIKKIILKRSDTYNKNDRVREFQQLEKIEQNLKTAKELFTTTNFLSCEFFSRPYIQANCELKIESFMNILKKNQVLEADVRNDGEVRQSPLRYGFGEDFFKEAGKRNNLNGKVKDYVSDDNSDDSGNISNELELEFDDGNVATSSRIFSSSESLVNSNKEVFGKSADVLSSETTSEGKSDDEKIFFRSGVLTQLESQRDERLAGMVINLQAHCRGYLARRKLSQRKLQDLAVRCIQRNVRKFLLVRDWPWWRLLVRVTPLLNVHRTEEELKTKTEELEVLKAKLEKLEAERTTLKHDNDKLEAKLSEMTADLAEEHSTSTLAGERLDAESSERVRLERELTEVQQKNKNLQNASERLEMELLYARSDLNGISEDDEDADGEAVYKQRYERVVRELEFTKRRLQQQHEDDLEQLVGLKKQLEKKLTDAYEEVEEQRQVVGQWKRKVQKLNGEMNDLKLLLEEQNSRNNLLEKKQRKFDSEIQLLQDELKKEKQGKDRLSREKEVVIAEKYTLESNLADVRLELELKEEKFSALQSELDELTYGGKTEEEVTILRKQKIDCERRLHDQDEELDELAGQVQLLEQAKLKLEMSLEQQRKTSKKEAQQHEEELEEVRCNTQKKLKALEAQLENEHEERTLLLREKHELERRLTAALENDRTEKACDEAVLQRLKRDLKRTKALLRDTQAQLERQKAETPNKALIRQLRNQNEDLECARSLAVKAKQTLESDLSETQAQLEEATRQKNEAEERANSVSREKADLQTQVEENEEELAEVLKKYKTTIQQMSLDQIALQEQVSLVTELEIERNTLKEQLAELTSKLESVESMGDASSHLLVKRTELKVKELESKLDLEQTTKSRLEVQISRLKEAVEKLQHDLVTSRTKEQQCQDQIRKLQRNLRELKDEHNTALTKESESLLRRKELEKQCETLESDVSTARADLRIALKRIEDLQAVIQNELEDSTENSESDHDSYSSDDSVNTFLVNHKISSSKSSSMQFDNQRRLSSASRSSTSSNLAKDSSYA